MSVSSQLSVLAIGPMDEDQASLKSILTRSDWFATTGGTGRLEFCSGLEAGISIVRNSGVPIVLCHDEVDWRQILERLRGLPAPPFLIVTSRRADDRLWCEALNLGAYDVLAKPFDSSEVLRVLTMAWRRSTARVEVRGPVKRARETAQVLFA